MNDNDDIEAEETEQQQPTTTTTTGGGGGTAGGAVAETSGAADTSVTAATGGIRKRQDRILVELASTVDLLVRTKLVLDDIVALTEPAVEAEADPESNAATTGGNTKAESEGDTAVVVSLAAKQRLLIDELKQWKDVGM